MEGYGYKSDSLNVTYYFVYDFAGYKYYEYNIRQQEPYVTYLILNFKENWESKFGCRFDYSSEEYSGILNDGTGCNYMYRSQIEFWLDKSNAIGGITNKEFDFIKNDTAIDKEAVDQYRKKLIDIDTNYLK